MGCIVIKSKKTGVKSEETQLKLQISNGYSAGLVSESVSLFTIKEENAKYEESALPSRIQSTHPLLNPVS